MEINLDDCELVSRKLSLLLLVHLDDINFTHRFSYSFIVLIALMFSGWGVIFAKQSSGKYLCEKLFIQLDDSLVPSLGTMSGLYILNRYYQLGGRVTYVGDGVRGIVGYCEDESRWTLTRHESGVESDPCRDWSAASSESLDYDITKTTASQWYAQTKGRVLPIDQTYIQCYDCKYKETFCGEHLSRGTCMDNTCNCIEGYGLRCEFNEPCSSLEVDPRSKGFVGNRVFASKYYYSFDLYHRPTYTSVPGENINTVAKFTGSHWLPIYTSETEEDVDTLMFVGRRWVLTSSGVASFISEAVHMDSRADMLSYPLGLEWHPALVANDGYVQGPDLSRNVDVTLICSECHNQTNPCLFESTCLPDGTCNCAHGSTGTLCQIPPLANGRCDTYFNKPEFEYDGGDCCEKSCVSTAEFTCGKDPFNGFVDTGYFFCKATENEQWSQNGNPVYGVNSAARSGSSVVLGGNGGTILAVGDPGASQVRLFDKDGKDWVQRGQALQGPPNSDFGFAITLSGVQNVRKNAFTSPAITLAVGAPGAGLVRVYECQTNGCVQVGSDIVQDGVSRFGTSISLSTGK